MKFFLIALQFLTILPCNIKRKIEDKDFGRSLAYFPVVGLLLGVILAGVAYASALLPPPVTGALILAAWIAMTGGIHLDGFADTCDGFYGNRTRGEILAIMRDSRIGSMGAAGITMLLLFKFAMLSSIPCEHLWKIVIMTPVFARWSQAFACATSGYARDEGKAKHFIGYAKKRDMFIGALFVLLLNWSLMGIKGIVLFALPAGIIFLFIRYAERKIGGMTGDTIGATNEIAEAVTLLSGIILLNWSV